MTKTKHTPLDRDEQGNLAAYAWPGGYPIYYLTADSGVLCPHCANTEKEVREADTNADCPDYDQWRIVESDANYEDDNLFCDNCNGQIASAYGENA